jgi:hypothetical protein
MDCIFLELFTILYEGSMEILFIIYIKSHIYSYIINWELLIFS